MTANSGRSESRFASTVLAVRPKNSNGTPDLQFLGGAEGI